MKKRNTFNALKKLADFESAEDVEEPEAPGVSDKSQAGEAVQLPVRSSARANEDQVEGINLSYTINLNLPTTTDIEVFNAIFKSLRDHLLQK